MPAPRPPRRVIVPWLAALGLVLGCDAAGTVPPGPAPDTDALNAHVLSRIGYGPDAFSRARIDEIGARAYVAEQLAPDRVADPLVDAMRASRPALDMGFHGLVEAFPLGSGTEAEPLRELLEMKLLRSIHGRRQLEQVLVDFWFDHFNVYAQDGIAIHAVIPFERDAIRPHVLGRFEDMLHAVARSPAMLFYLDNYRSRREGFVYQGEVGGLNENYARELLELHTVGVDGGYDQQDVIEVARAFTGWTIGPRPLAERDGFLFWPEAHDPGPKSVMGELRIAPGGGRRDGRDVIAFLAAHPRTAAHLCRKLVVRFVDETPPEEVVTACREAYLERDGDLRAALRAILLSPAFLDVRRAGAKVKRPIHFVASLARASGMRVEGVDLPGGTYTLLDALVHFVDLMGEPLYRAPAPDGLPDASAHWASAGALVSRFKLVEALVEADVLLGMDFGAAGGSDAEVVDAVADTLLPGGLSDATRGVVLAHLAPYRALPLQRRAREAAALLLSSPDFMTH